MIRLPNRLRPLLLTRCFARRNYATEVSRKRAVKLADLTAQQQQQRPTQPQQKQPKQRNLPKEQLTNKRRDLPKVRGRSRTDFGTRKEKSLPGHLRPVKLSTQEIKEERYATTDIYNYTASQGLVPKVHITKVKIHPTSSKTYRKVTISLPEQGIESSATCRDFVEAQLAVAIDFKRQAEQYQSRQDKDTTTTPQGFELLNTKTVDNFFNFLRSVDRGTSYKVEIASTGKNRDKDHIAYVTANGQPVWPAEEQVYGTSKKEVEQIAWLVAAVILARQNPHLLEEFYTAMAKGKGKFLQPVAPFDMPVKQETVHVMRDALQRARSLKLPEMEETAPADEQSRLRRRTRRSIQPERFEQISRDLSAQLNQYLQDPKLERLRAQKLSLPMNQHKDNVLTMINENQYSIVVGATGSGKTTQVPQLLLDEAIKSGSGAGCNIICTQPRRIAAISVAQRVSVERNQKLGESIGYHVRFDKQLPEPGGSVTFCTTGILLEQLKHEADGIFDSASHLVIDEVHERDLNIDFLMIILKKAIKARKAAGKPVPKVVLMSATLDTDLFATYFNQSDEPGVIIPCPSVSVPGRTFPVKENFLWPIMAELERAYGRPIPSHLDNRKCQDYLAAERAIQKYDTSESLAGEESVIDWKRKPVFKGGNDSEVQTAAEEQAEALVPVPLVAATLAHICNTSDDGAILVFLPGLAEILETQEILASRDVFGVDFRDTRKFKISTLHSTTSKEGQAAVFDTVPRGCRKIILSTNIAETSVTIPDVQYVIDSGKHREKRYDQLRRISKLQCTWISKSNSKQRAGRAGRVQNGNYYALFARERYEMLRSVSLPELLRSDLQETCLATKMQSQDDSIAQFLAQAIEPPAPAAVRSAVDNLKALEALKDDEELTPLGHLLSRLPVHPTLGKMIVLGVIFRCLDPLLILGAAAGERSLMLEPIDARARAREAHRVFNAGQKSDHIIMLNAYNAIRRVRDTKSPDSLWRFSNENFLHMGAFKNVDSTAKQIENTLVEVGLIPPRGVSGGSRSSRYGHPDFNENAGNIALVKCLLLAGLHPNLAAQKSVHSMSFRTLNEATVIPHMSSVNSMHADRRRRDRQVSQERELVRRAEVPERSILAFTTMGESQGSLFLRETTLVTPLMCAMFGGEVKVRGARIDIDDWLPLFAQARDREGAAHVVVDFKAALNRTMRHAFRSLSSFDRGGSFIADDSRDVFVRSLVTALNLEEGQQTAQMAYEQPWPALRSNVTSAQGSQDSYQKPAWRSEHQPSAPGRFNRTSEMQSQVPKTHISPSGSPYQRASYQNGRPLADRQIPSVGARNPKGLDELAGARRKSRPGPDPSKPAASLFMHDKTQSEFAKRYPHLFS